MNLKARLSKLEGHHPPVDEEQRHAMIASIQEWLNELEMKAPTDRDAYLYLQAIRNMLGGP